MLNKNVFKITLIIFILLGFTLCSFSLKAEEQQTPEKFTEYIYANYASENFEEVYANFADELKKIISEEEYIEFQKRNFNKYSLEYSSIDVNNLEELSYEEFKNKFSFVESKGNFYSIEVSYLLKFQRLGAREEETKKRVYLRQNNSDINNETTKKFHLFWDPEPIVKNEDSESVN